MSERQSEKLKHLENLSELVRVVDTKLAGPDHPVIQSFYDTLFVVAGRVQPRSPAYPAAQRVLDAIEANLSPNEISIDDIEKTFHAGGATFIRVRT